MAGTLSFSGISVSGLDTSGWVDALVSVKQQTITSLEQQKEEQEKLLDVVNNIKTFFSSFQSCLSKITDSQFGIPTMDLFLQNLAISSNTNIATATATTEAARQSYDVLVDSLATSTKATSGHVIYEEIFATMDTKIGLLGAKNGTITVNSQAFSVTTEDTIRDLISKFQQVGVSAKFDEEKGTFTVGVSLSEIDEGATGIKSALKLKDNTVSGAVSGSLVYATRDTEFSKLGLTAGKVVIEGIEHTISKNGDNYTITPNGGNTYALNTVGHFLDYLKVTLNAEYADIDNIGNITIKGATLDKVNGGSNLLDVLNLSETTDRLVMESSKLTYNQNHVADLTTELSSLGITNTTTLTVGGTTHNITSDKTLGDVKDLLKAGGVDFAIDKDGVITINTNGNEISGTLLDALGLDASKGGTTITSSAHTSRYDADGNTLLSELGITDSMKYVAYKSDGTALTGEISGLSGKTLNEFVSDLKAKGLNASFDSTTHQIIIDDGYIEGTLADALGMSSEITKYTEAATLDTTLEKLGATGNQTLSIDGGASKSYGKDTKLSTVIDDIKAAGGEVNFKDGNLEIKGVTLGGTLPTLLGLDATTQGSSVTSSALTVVTGADSSGSGMTETVEHDITLDSKIGDILGTTTDYTLKVGDGNTVTYTKDTTLASLKNQIESAGGTFKINDDNTITIDDVTMTGTLVGALGFDSIEDGTRFSTVNPVMVVGTTNVANGSTALGSLGSGIATFAAPTTYSLSINGGTAKNYDSGTTLDQIFADIEAAGGTAEIDSEGYIVIEGVELEGTLLDKLGLEVTSYKTTITSGNLEVTTSTTSTSSSVLYGEDGGDITWDSTIGSIVGDTNSYSLIVNGTNKNFATTAKLSDVKSAVEAAGGTMTINSDNTISIDGVEISGTLFDVLGFVTTDYDTVISSNNPIYAKGEDKEATSSTKFSELGIADNLRDYAIYKNDGTVIKVSSTTNTTGDSTIGDWLNTLNTQLNAANGTSGKTYAKIENGVISITGGYITGSLPTALGIRTETVVTGGSVSGGSISYVEYEPLKYISGVDLGVGESSTDITSTGTIGSSVNQSGTAAENTTSTGSIGVNGTQGGNAEGDMSSTGLIGTSINQSGTASSDISSSGLIGPEDEFVDLFGNITDATLDATLAELLTPGASDPLNNDARLPASSYTLKIGSYATKTFNSSTTTLRDVVTYIENLKTYDPTYDMAFDAYLSGDKLVIKTDTEVTGTLADVLGLTKVKTEDEYYTYVAKSVKYTDLVEGGSNGYNFSITGSGKIEYDTTTTVASGGFEFTGEKVTYTTTSEVKDVSSVSSFESGKTYSISTAEDLRQLAIKVNSGVSTIGARFIVTADIDMSSITDFQGIGNENYAFNGSFDGGGHSITGVRVSGTHDNLGFFGWNTGEIENFELSITVNGSGDNVGGLVGLNGGTGGSTASSINSVKVSGTVSGAVSGFSNVGGVVGYNDGGYIYYVSTEARVLGGSGDNTGGFAGKNNSRISNSFVDGGSFSASGRNYTGGFVGYNASGGYIDNSGVVGQNVSGDIFVGGFVGLNDSGATIISSFSEVHLQLIEGNTYGAFVGVNKGSVSNGIYMTDQVGNNGSKAYGANSTSTSGFVGLTASQINDGQTLYSYGFSQDPNWSFGSGSPTLNPPLSPSGGGSTTTTKILSQYTKISELFDGSTATQTLKLQVAGGAEESLTFNSTDSVQTIIDKLADYGISAVVTSEGKFKVTSDERWTLSGALASKLFGGSGNEVYTYVGTKVTYTETTTTPGNLTSDGFITTPGNHSGSASGGTVTAEHYGFIGDVTNKTGSSNAQIVTYTGNKLTYQKQEFNELKDRTMSELGLRSLSIQITNSQNQSYTINASPSQKLSDFMSVTGNGFDFDIREGSDGRVYLCFLHESSYKSLTINGANQQTSYNNPGTNYIIMNQFQITETATTSTTLGNLYDDTSTTVHNFNLKLTGQSSQTLTFNSSDTIQSVINKLAEKGVTATLNSEGKFVVTSTNGTLESVSGELAEKLFGGTIPTPSISNPSSSSGKTYVSSLDISVDDFLSGNTYYISSVTDLEKLATFVNSGKNTQGVTFILENDINLSSIANFTPIGSSSNAFKGNFYGNGHIISNLKINSSADEIGLFGYIENALIQDIGLENVEIKSTSTNAYVGALVARAAASSIYNNYVKGGSVSGYYIGGLVGRIDATEVIKSYTDVTVSGYASVGGLVGNVYSGSISKSFSNGDVSGTDVIGGLVGYLQAGSIDNSYSTGDVDAILTTAGGLVGQNGYNGNNLINVYATGNVNVQNQMNGSYVNAGALIGKIQTTLDNVTNAVYNTDSGLAAIGSGTATGITGKTLSEIKTQSIMEGLGFTSTNGWQYTSGVAPYLGNITTSNPGAKVYVSTLTDFVSGNTYYVKSAADLNKLAELVNAGKDTSGVKFILENDIDMSGVSNFAPIGNTLSNSFKGEFYGNGHVISNLQINVTGEDAGLFGSVSGAIIQDVGLENVDITGTAVSTDTLDTVNVGALVAYLSESIVDNCYVSGGTVTGLVKSTVGGLIGLSCSWSTSSSSITNSYADVSVTGGLVGGFIGASHNNTTINKCFAIGSVTDNAGENNSSGGFAGQLHGNTTITNSYSTSTLNGTIYGFAGALDGISDSNNITLTNCYATTGTKFGSYDTPSRLTITNCIQLGSGISEIGVTGATYDQIVDQSFMTSHGFTSSNGWQYTSGSTPHFGNMSGSAGSTTTTTHDATLNTTVSKLFGDSASHTLTVDGTDITFSSTDNISDILNKLWSDKKIYGTMENGVISLDSNDDHVLTGDLAQKLFGSATVDLQGSNGGASDKYTMERSEDGSASTTVTTTHTLAADTYIGDLFGDSSNHTFTVNGEDITLGPDKTIQDLINALAGKGVTMTITDGKVFLGSNNLGEFTVSGDLANKILGRSGTINGDCVTQEVTLSTSSKIKDIFWDNDTHYFKINKASGGTVSISLSGNDTIQTLIDKLQNNGIVATIDSSGKMTFKSNYKWTASGDLADIITGSSSMSMSTTYLYTYETEELEVYTGHQFVSQMLNSGQTLIKGFRYHIATIDDLKALATFVNNRGLDTTDIDFVLDGNITLNSSFVSIGTSSNAFKGNFYGNGNTISGAQKTIFAYTSGAEIRDVGVINANVSGGDNTGILVGKGSSTKITNTYVTGSVSGGSNTGALAGSLTGSTVTDSYSTATVSGSSNVGGLVGSTTTTNITRAYATGDVTASGSKVGGFVGNHASGTITAAYATGNVKGNSTVGGFVGANSGTISNSYSISRVYGTTNGAFAGSNSGTFSGNVYNSNLEIAGVGSGSSSGLTAKTFVDMQNQSIMESLGFTAAKGWKYTQYNTPYLGTITTDVSGGTRRVSQVSEFRAGDTYYINDVTDLNALSTFLKNGADTTGVTFILNNDIDMSGVSNFTPIGSATNTFKGDFYGNGHTISNLKVSTSNANAGLFGVIEDSHIQDVCINGVSVSGGSNTGALVGQVTGTSTIKNISVKGGTVTGSGNNLGGLIGSLSSNSTLTESYTALTVQSSSSISNVGGLIGNNNGTVSKTYTDGEVKASSATNVGGLIGTNSGKVSTSYVMRNVTGATNVGGFIGTNSGNVSNSYSIADVSGSVSGGFIGKNNGGTLSGNVYNIGSGDAVVNAQGVGSGSSTGINGLVIEDMRKKDVMEAQGFTSSNGWSYLNYVTPVLGGVTATGGGKIYVDSSLTEFEIGDTYYINSAAQLKRLAEMVNAGHDTAGIVFVLENDITLDSSFTSIGTSTEMFKGDFHGNGHTISGAQDTIFAYTHNAKIQDVGVINANVSGGDNTGILVGYGEHNTEIINSYVNGSVSGSNNVGGLAGALVDSTVINSFSNAVVNGANTVGGLLGKVTNTTVKSSYATGDVTASGNTAGGFIGQLVSGSITTAYAEGNVLASSNVGGFVGTNGGTISNAYSIGRVHGNNRGAFAGTNNGTMTGNVYNSNLEINATGTGSTSGITAKTFVEMQNQSIMESLGFTSDKGWKYISNLIAPVLNGVGKIDDDGIVYVKELSEFKAGDTYYIKDAADLKKLSELVNAGEDTTGTVFILEGDIDMSGVSNFTPIGSASNTFKGDFYGNGHTISNLKINTTSDPNIKETGLFGYLEKAVIRDLAITDATVSGNGKTGILAGYADADTVIENSYTTGSVTSSGDGTGGFIGINYGTIKKSYTTAKVSGQNDTGGFVGYNYGTISSAYATGDVVGKNNSGGFAGSNKGTITTAYSIGQVESTGSQVGGFVGYAVTGSNISNVFTASHADGVSNVGGFAGKADSGVTFTGDVYNTSTNLGAVGSGTSTGITGLEYKKIWIQSEMEALGFTADKGWLYSENTTPYLNTNSTLTNSTGKVYVSQVDSFISGEVFYIATKADLQKLAELVNNGALTDGVSFVLENDIDASGVASIGNSEANAFNGVFYGNGNKITGLTNSLFRYTEEAFIRDVAVDVNISGSGSNVGALIAKDLGGSEINNSYSTGTISGNTNVGGLVGYLGSGSQVKNSYSEAKVTAATNAAGLVGVAEDAEIINSFSTGTVKATSSYAGGLVGRLNSGSVIDNSYSLSNVTSGNISGGLVGGVSSSTIKNSYSAGTVSGTGAKGFVGRTEGSNTISGNVYNKATTDSISGATGLTLDQLKHQATMESYGFTADRGWSYYEDETPTLKAKNYSGTGYDVDVTLDTTLERLGDTLISKDITVKVGNNTYQKDFKDTDTVSDVVNWLNSLSGVTASFDERNSQITISTDAGELSVTGGLANMLFGGYGSTSTTTITVNTDSSYVVAEGQNEKITEATTVKQLLKSNNAASIGFADENGQIVMETFEADQTLGEVKAFLEANGFDVKIENGVFTATKEGGAATDLYGAIGSALKGEVGTTTVTPSGYDSDILSSATSFVADKTTTLEKLGINSGNIHIKDSFGNIINSITIDNQMTVNDVAALLNNYGFTLDIVNGKVTVTGEGTNKIVDGTSNMVSKMKLDNWTSNKDKLTNTSTVAEMGFSTGASLGVSSSGKFMPDLNFNANDTLDTIIARLKNYGITASVDSNGKFTASADFSFVLTGELGVYLTQNSANGYEQIANGYKSENPFEFNKPVTELTEDTLIGELLGTGEGGVLRLTIDENDVYDLKYNANDTVSDIMADLAAYGITTKIENGVLTAVSLDRTFRFSGDIGDAISGRTPTYEDISTGYISKDLSYKTTGVANIDSTMKELGILSGEIHVLDNSGNILRTLSIDETFTVSQIKSMLVPYGFNMNIDSQGKISVTSSEGYTLSDGTSNMVSKMGITHWNKNEEKLSLTTTISEMGFKNGADLNLFLDGLTQNILSFDADETLQDVIFALSAYGIDASVNSNGVFTAESKEHTFIMSSSLGSFLTKGTAGYVNRDTGYQTYKPLEEEKDYYVNSTKNLDYNELMTEDSTLSSLGFENGGNVIVRLDDNTNYTLSFLGTDKISDVIFALSAYGINAEVNAEGKFVAESVDNQFVMAGNLGNFLLSGGNYYNETTGYISEPLNYDTVEKVDLSTKLTDLGVLKGDVNILKNGIPFATISITDETTVGQLFSAIKVYGIEGSIKTDDAGNTYIELASDSTIRLADGTSNVVSALNFTDIRQGDFNGNVIYWDDDASSGLITGDMKLSDFDKNGYIAQGSLIFETGTGDSAVEHIINISADETVNSLLKKFNDAGITATLENGLLKIHSGIDGITFKGGTSGLINTMSLDIDDIDTYASSDSALSYNGDVGYSSANFADAGTLLSTVNVTEGQMNIFIDGIKCTVQVNTTDTFADLFSKISAVTAARTGVTVKVGFLDRDGNIVTNPTATNNTGIIAIEAAEGHELVIGSSIDTTNFATIANLNKTGYSSIKGSRALYKVNSDSLITGTGLFRAGDVTEGTFKIGDAEFTIDSTTTINQLMEQINKSEKAYATAYWDTLSGRMVIESTLTGASLINIEAGTSNFTDIMGFTAVKDGEKALVTDTQKLGKNAIIRINGTTITSASNVITSDISKIKGLTINLKGLSQGETTTITVEQDDESIYNAVAETLDAYNAMMEALNKELENKDSLGSDPLVKLMRNQLKRLMTSSLVGDYVFKNLAAIGISTGEASDSISTNVTSLLIDKDQFMNALDIDSDAVKELLVGTTTNPGIFLQASNIVNSAVNSGGYFTNLAESLTRSITKTEQKISSVSQDIENYKLRLERNFQNMETAISSLQNSYSNFLSKVKI